MCATTPHLPYEMLPAAVGAVPLPTEAPLRPVELVLEGCSAGRTGRLSDAAPTLAALDALARQLYALPAVALSFRYLYRDTTPVALATDTDLQYAFNLLRARDPAPDAPRPSASSCAPRSPRTRSRPSQPPHPRLLRLRPLCLCLLHVLLHRLQSRSPRTAQTTATKRRIKRRRRRALVARAHLQHQMPQ